MIRKWLLALLTEAIAKGIYSLIGSAKIHPLEEAQFILGEYEVKIKRIEKLA